MSFETSGRNYDSMRFKNREDRRLKLNASLNTTVPQTLCCSYIYLVFLTLSCSIPFFEEAAIFRIW